MFYNRGVRLLYSELATGFGSTEKYLHSNQNSRISKRHSKSNQKYQHLLKLNTKTSLSDPSSHPTYKMSATAEAAADHLTDEIKAAVFS